MVRETRHLWVGNLPDNIREDRIRDHFKRYGRVQSIKIFSRKGGGGGECDGSGLVGCGICATVSFMDIKSASKAHNNEHKLDEHLLTTEYHEPGPIPPTASPASNVPPSVSAGGSPVTQATPPSLRHPPPYSSPRFTHGPSEEITTTFDRSSHFYERRDGSENYARRTPSSYHVVSPSESLRSRTRDRDRIYRNGPSHYTPILESVVARTPATHHRTVTTTSWNSYDSTSCSRYPSSVVTTPEILSYQEERRESTPVIIVHKKHPKSRRKCRVMNRCGSNGSESVSNNSDSSRSRSHSSSSSSHSRSSSSSSDSSSAAISERSCSTHSHHGSLKSTVTVHSTISTPLTNCSPVVHTDDRRPLAICVRNLPTRSSDSSVKDGLYHEYKKHGKVTHAKVVGQGANRYAIVCFKKADDVDKAMQTSHDKLLFGSKIDVSIYHGFDVDDSDLRPGEAELDEYHPKATRTLFIGNLEKDVTVSDLRNTFQKFGEIIDIDIRKQGTTCYAFCQYCDISSVVKAMNAMDGEYLGNNKINLGYGNSLLTNCLWVAGVADCVTEKQLIGSFSQFGHVTHVDINRSQGKALVFFQQSTHAQAALSQMRGYNLKNRRLMADYASPECQENFYEHYEKSKSTTSVYENNCQDSPRSTGSTRGLDTPVSSSSSNGGGNAGKHNASSSTTSNSNGGGGGNSNNGSGTNNAAAGSGSNSSSGSSNNTSSSNNNNNNSSSSSSTSTSNISKARFQHTLSTPRTTPTHQPVQQMPSSNSASPIVNNTPSPSPSTSSRSTPRPQQASRFDYTSALECSSDRRISRSFEDLNANVENSEKPSPRRPDDVTLQKERVSLLEQLNNYSSSDEDEEEEELAALKQQAALRRQRSNSREESRPGTPLCDERPENILAHYESRRAAKEKSANNTPLSLPLPSFANKVSRSTSPTSEPPQRPSKSPHVAAKPSGSRAFDGLPSRNSACSYAARQSPSPHVAHKDKSALDSKPGGVASPFEPPAETPKAPWLDQLKSLEEKYEKWSVRTKVLAGKLDTSAVQTKHKLLDVNAIGRQRSEICQTVLSRKSVFDDHFKRLETITDQPQPAADFVPPRVAVGAARSHSLIPTPVAVSAPVAPPVPSLVPKTTASSIGGSSGGILSGGASSANTISSFVMKGLQYPFPSHPPPPKSALPKLNTAFALLTKPDTSQPQHPQLPNSAPVLGSNPRTPLLLRNNSVEKLTDLPKNSSPVTAPGAREPLSRLECGEPKKEVPSPCGSRRSSVESLGRKSIDDDTVKDKKVPAELPKSVIVNHVTESKPKPNCTYESCKIVDRENSVLDKRKMSIERTASDVPSSPFHHRDKPNKTEEISECEKITNSRRSSIESSTDDDRVPADRVCEKFVETINHTKVKINDTRPDVKLYHKSAGETKRDKHTKSESSSFDEVSLKTVPFNHVTDDTCLESKKKDRDSEERRPSVEISESSDEKVTKNENTDSGAVDEDDDDDDDSNDVDSKTITVKNKIIETVFHIKHEKKKSIDSKAEVTDDKKPPLEKKKSVTLSDALPIKSKEPDVQRDSTGGDAKLKKECLKTKEFNMFENKPNDKKKNHFLSEPRKSVELDSKVEPSKNNKYKESKERENVEQSCERTKAEKKKERHSETKHKEIEKRKSEEKRDDAKAVTSPVEPEKHKSEEKFVDRKYDVHKPEPKKEVSLKPKDTEKEVPKEKKKEKLAGQPENGKIKHHDYKKFKEQDNHKKLVIECPDVCKERKNSSGSSSLSDSVPSRSKLSSFDSLESNAEDKSRHNSIDNESQCSKKFERQRHNSSVADANSGKDEKRSDSSRSKKLEKSNSSSKHKKSKKRKTLTDSSSDSEFESFDEAKLKQKNHSIFDVVLDEPAYISMYDKVKARSTKNLQKQEEEKRQEKLKEKFSQLKQSRVKREEKKRSTSYDDDTDAERTVSSRKGNKLILDSSDEDHSSTDKIKEPVPQTDSSDDERSKQKMLSDGESEPKPTKYKKTARRSLSAKSKEKSKHALTDTSEDEMKLKQKREHQFALLSENKRKFNRSMSKKRPSATANLLKSSESKKKSESDMSEEDKLIREETKSFFSNRGPKMEAKKVYSDFTDDEDDDVTHVTDLSTSNSELLKKVNIPDNAFMKRSKPKIDLKAMIEKGELNRVNNFAVVDNQKSKMRMLISDVSEEEEVKPNMFDNSGMKKNDFLVESSQAKFDRLLSDTSENESVKSLVNRFQPKCTRDLFGDDVVIKREERGDELFNNLAELHHDFVKSENLSPPPLLDPMAYDMNEYQKKKSHKKKQKRQKSREHSVDRIKKHSKKERRKSILSDAGDEESKEKEHKQKKKKKNRNKIKTGINLEEDIFGSMSDDSEKMNDSTKLSKLSVSDVYDADSDSSNKDVREKETVPHEEPKFPKLNSDMSMSMLNSSDKPNNNYENFFEHMKPKKKKRKKSKEEKSKNHHHHPHHHRRPHHHAKPVEKAEVSPPPPPLPLLVENMTPSAKTSQTFEFDEQAEITPKDDGLPDAPKDRKVLHQEAIDIVTSSIAESINEEIKEATRTTIVKDVEEVAAVKSISNPIEEKPTERSVVDVPCNIVTENIHDRAVMSISQVLTVPNAELVEQPVRPVEEKASTPVVEDKTSITISQEETEDAVAAILGESAEFVEFNDCYAGDTMKPDTPGSDRSLQIDTDVEDMSTTANKSDTEDLVEEDLKCSSDEGFEITKQVGVISNEPSRDVPTNAYASKDISDNSNAEVNTSNTSSYFVTPEKLPSLEHETSLDDSATQESAESTTLIRSPSSDSSKIENLGNTSGVTDLSRSESVADDSIKSSSVSESSLSEVELPVKTPDKPNLSDSTFDNFLPNVCKENSGLESSKEVVKELPISTPEESSSEPEKKSILKIDTATPAPEVSKEPIAEPQKPDVPAISQLADENTIFGKAPEKHTFNNCAIPLKSTHHLPNNIIKPYTDRTVLAKVEAVLPYFKNVPLEPSRGDVIKVNEDGVKEVKSNERKRSYAECNGPSHLNDIENERLRPYNDIFPVPSVEVKKPESHPKLVESIGKLDPEVAEPTKPVLIENSLPNETTKLEAPVIVEKEVVESLPIHKELSLSDHTYNSIIKKPSTPDVDQASDHADVKESFCSVIMERVADIDAAKEKEEPVKLAPVEDTKPTVVTDTDLALKQKLPIPAQQNMEVVESKEKERSNTEVNEANKENIVKAVLNQDNVGEGIDDTRSNVILKDKEITRSVEDEIFKGVANDFSKSNHKVPENNRNILEKVVQRIHEAKRTIQKTEDSSPAAIVANVTPSPDKVTLATEEEITSAEILLKMSESTVVKAQVSDYNCVLKVNHEPEVLDPVVPKLEEKDCSFYAIKNDSVSSCDLQGESNEETCELADDSHGVETGAKVTDHVYNAKRGRRRKAAAPGGVTTRRGKQNHIAKGNEPLSSYKTTKKTSADVYEFKEDSEEEVKRPRLILTIKSPIEPPSVPVTSTPVSVPPATETSVITETKSVSPASSNTSTTTSPSTPKSTSAHTRKSRRLQEKGGPRAAAEPTPVVEKPAKTALSPRPTRRTTRIAAQAAAAIITTVHESTRKNTRGAAKKPPPAVAVAAAAAAAMAMATTTTTPAAAAAAVTAKTEVAAAASAAPVAECVPTSGGGGAAEEEDDDYPASSPSASSAPSISPSAVAAASPVSARTSTEPTNLIDPVSGLLIPMKEAEEGQYVPVLTDLNQSQETPEYPPEKKARWDDTVAEESAMSLVKCETSTAKVVASAVVAAATTTTAAASDACGAATASTVATSVIAAVPSVTAAAAAAKTATAPKAETPPVARVAAPCPAADEKPISLIKTNTPSIVTPAAALKSLVAHTVAYNPPYSPMVYTQSQSAAKLHTSKTVIPQPRVLTPITPKAHIIQTLNAESDTHSNDEVPYPPQYTSPLLHGAVASPPLGSPKISPQPIVTGANNSRVAHPIKSMGPLEPLKIDSPASFYYLQNISPQSRGALSVQSPSPQPRVIHNTPALNSNLLPHAAVQPAHYIHPPQFIYPYMQESSLTAYHLPPPAQSTPASATTAKIITDREIIESRQAAAGATLSVTPSPPLELRKKTSPRPRVSDSPLITNPYVQSSRPFYYDEPARRPLQGRVRVSTPPYAGGKAPPPQTDAIDMYVPARVHLEAARYAGHAPPHDDDEEGRGAAAYAEGGAFVGALPTDTRVAAAAADGELDYSRRGGELALCERRMRDSPGSSEMDSPPLGDSPPQGNLDGTVLVQMYPIIWQGVLALKNDSVAIQMHVVSGNSSVAFDALPKIQDGYQPLLRIAQRMRLEQAQLDGVNRKMEIKDEHCTILGLPCGKNQEDVLQQATNLESCIIPYLQQKKAAGIINTAAPGMQQAAFVVHVFPPCEFADNVLLNAAPDLYRKVQETAYLVCIIVTV